MLLNCSEKIISKIKSKKLTFIFLPPNFAGSHVIESHGFVTLRRCLSSVTAKKGG